MACKSCNGGVVYSINEQYFIDVAVQNATIYAKAKGFTEMVIFKVDNRIYFKEKGNPEITGEIIQYLYVM